MVTSMVLKISKSITFASKMHSYKSTKKIKRKTSAWFENYTLLCMRFKKWKPYINHNRKFQIVDSKFMLIFLTTASLNSTPDFENQ